MQGYVYALINTSLPDMIKVGQTSRYPEDRAKELSSATGVPTPFIVGYSVKVSDCQAAEHYAHERLTQRGIRVTENREFFRATLQDIVRVLVELETKFPISTFSMEEEENHISDKSNVDSLAEELISEGFNYLTGTAEYFKDHYEAEKKFQAALRLGGKEAKYYLGVLYADKESSLYNPRKAAKLLNESYESDIFTYASLSALAILYVHIAQPRNVEIAYTKFFKDKKLEEVFLNFEVAFQENDSNDDFPPPPDIPDSQASDEELDELIELYLETQAVYFENKNLIAQHKKEICAEALKNASSHICQYFLFLSDEKVKAIETSFLFTWLPLIEEIAHTSYESSPTTLNKIWQGINLYKFHFFDNFNT